MGYLIKTDASNYLLELLPGDLLVDRPQDYQLDEDETKFEALNTAPFLECWTYSNGVLTLDEIKYAKLAAPQLDTERIEAIKTEARQRIINQIPGGTMENYLEKENYLHGMHSKYLSRKINGETLTTTEQTHMKDLEVIYDKLDDIIKMSNEAEINGDTLETFQLALDTKGY